MDGIELSDENARQVYIPRGFAHGFCVLSESADFIINARIIMPHDDYGIAWNDPS